MIFRFESPCSKPIFNELVESFQLRCTIGNASPDHLNVLFAWECPDILERDTEWIDRAFRHRGIKRLTECLEPVRIDFAEEFQRHVGLVRISEGDSRRGGKLALTVGHGGCTLGEVYAYEQAHSSLPSANGLNCAGSKSNAMTDDPDPPDEEPEHRFSRGQGFDDPYEGFDLDPPEFDVDPDEVDPVDAHVVTDLLDDRQIPATEVDVEELIDVGLSYMGINRHEQAVETFERAAQFSVAGSDSEQEAWVNKGVAHAELEEWDAAIGAYREALFVAEDGPHTAEAHTNLAYALWESGEVQSAYQHAEDAVRENERLPHAWYNLGFIEAEQGRHEEAVDCFEKADQLGFRGVELFEEKKRSLEALGREEEAKAAAEQAADVRERREDDLVG